MIRTAARFVRAVISTSPRQAAAAAVVMAGLTLTEGAGILLLVPLLSLVGVTAGQGPLHGIVARLAWIFAAARVQPTLPAVLAVYVTVAAVQSVLQRWQLTLTLGVQQDFMAALRTRIYGVIARAEWAFLARSRAAEAVHVLTAEIDRSGQACTALISLSVSSVVALVYLGIACRVSLMPTVLVMACGITLALTLGGQLRRAGRSGEHLSESSARVYAAIAEHLASMKTAKSYGMTDHHASVFAALTREARDVHLAATGHYAGVRQRLGIGVPVVLAVVVYVSYGVVGVSTAALLLLLFLFARLMPRLTGVYENLQAFATALPAFGAIRTFEDRCLAASEPATGASAPVVFRDALRFDRVTFAYPGGGAVPALAEANLVIEAGATTAIVGPSGAGKTTMADLLLGLLTPARGRIVVDGHTLGRGHLGGWRETIGYVAQDTFLFHDTVRANLLWGRPSADESDLWHALHLAAADEFVSRLPRGLDTVLGDRGVLVSGGERQRLSLARALLRKPSLLILDEATSSLDSENELRIQQAIEGLHQQMTIVVITHRLSTIRHADVIHVVDGGRVVESGSWDVLAADPHGRFRALCAAQGIDTLTALVSPEPTRRPWPSRRDPRLPRKGPDLIH